MSEDVGEPMPTPPWPPPPIAAASDPPPSWPPPLVEAAAPEGDALQNDAATAPRKRSILRRIFRPWVVTALVTAFIIAGNLWMYLLLDGWRTEDRELREAAHAAAASVGEANAVIESQEAMLALLASQAQAAQDRATELDDQIAAKKDISDGYKNAALAYERCGDKRAEAIATLWAGGSASALVAAADAECAAAEAQLNALEGGN